MLLNALKGVRLTNLTDMTKLQKIKLKSLLKNISGSIRPKQTKQLTAFASETGTIAKKGGLKSASLALEYADDAPQMKKLAKLSNVFGSHTQALFKLAGKSLLFVWDIAALLAALFLPILISFIMLVIWLFRLIMIAILKKDRTNIARS